MAGLVLCLGVLGGCNIIGPAYLLVHGPEKTPAQHELDKQRPTVVFVDDRASVLPRRAMRQQIGAATQNTLLKEHVLKNVIDTTAIMNAAAHETSGEQMDIASLARAVQAEVVIYVTVDAFMLSPDGQTFSPEARYHVKVIDVTKPNARVWPAEHEGHPVAVMMRTSTSATPKSATEQATALTALTDRSGTAIAQLFFSHEATHEQTVK
jgi:hypothetical protein